VSRGSRALERILKTISIAIVVTASSPSSARAEEAAGADAPSESVDASSTGNWWDQMIPPTSLTGDLGRVDLHGFGSWAFADTNGNPYLGGTASSSWDNIAGGVLVSAQAFERLWINAQISADTREGDSDLSLERMFVQWTFADWLKIRGGRSPHPIGIYSEVLNVGTTRPFFDLPQGVYGPTGTTTLSYDGAGVTGSIVIKDWEFAYDVYGGEAEAQFAAPYVVAVTGPIPTPGSIVNVTSPDTVGGRLQIMPPIDGLTLGLSAYTTQAEGTVSTHFERIVYGGQFEFERENYSLRAEYYKQEADEFKTNADAGYVMGTVRPFGLIPVGEIGTLLDRIEIAAMYNVYAIHRVEPAPGFPIPTPKQLKNHREWAVGLNYWFTPTFVARAEYHMVMDNIFAHEGATLLNKLGPPRDLDNETQLVKVGLDFSF